MKGRSNHKPIFGRDKQGSARRIRVLVLVNQEEYEAIDRLMVKVGKSRSELIREIVMERINELGV